MYAYPNLGYLVVFFWQSAHLRLSWLSYVTTATTAKADSHILGKPPANADPVHSAIRQRLVVYQNGNCHVACDVT